MENGEQPTVEQHLRKILADMEAKGLAAAEVSYDGIGDSGNVEDTRLFDADGTIVLPAGAEQIADALEEAVFALLQDRKPGWELNSGSYGRLRLEVGAPEADLDHCWRCENYDGVMIDLATPDLFEPPETTNA